MHSPPRTWPTLLALVLALLVSSASWAQQTAARMLLPPGEVCTPLPFRLHDHRLFIDVMIGGKGPYAFIFDTGASHVVSLPLAKELGLTLGQEHRAGGAGEGLLQSWRADVSLTETGGLRIENAQVIVFSLEDIRAAIGFDRLDGILGREVLHTFLTRIDFDASLITLCDPARAPPGLKRGTPIAFQLAPFDAPVIETRIDGRPATLLLDTGDRSTLTLFTPYVDQHALKSAYPARLPAITGWGVGGPIPAEVTRVGTLEFAGFSSRNVVLRMPQLSRGAFTSAAISGAVGTQVLKRFNITFDYKSLTAYLEPSRAFGDPFPFDRSGMWLSSGARGFEVAFVAPGSPAAEAGLGKGDTIVAAGGVPAGTLPLVAFRDRLHDDPPGTEVRMQVQDRDGALRTAVLILRDLI